jgi:rhamnulokinase
MSGNHFLALDLGAGSGRVILAHVGKKIELEEIHRFRSEQLRLLGHYYWDVLRIFHELKQGLAACAQKGYKDVLGIGIDTWGVDFGLVGRNKILLGNPVTYRDARTDGMMESAFKKIAREEIYKTTGIQFMQINTLFQLLSMVEADNPLLAVCEQLLFMPDLFNFMMTGEQVSEYTIASTSQLMNAKEKSWAANIFAKLSLPMNIMGSIVPPGTIVGPLLGEIREETGLHNVDVIAPACHDTASAVAAVPAKGDSWAYLSSGTWSLIGVEVDEPIINDESLQGNFTNEGGVGSRIRFLRNVTGMWLLEESRKVWAKQGRNSEYDELLSLAAEATPFKSIVDPDHSLFLNPPDMVQAISDYCQHTHQPQPDDIGTCVRCILESLAIKYRFVFDRLQRLVKKRIDTIHIVGGGSQNEMLNQFTANATGAVVLAGPVEATALGNVIVQAVAKGVLGSIEEGREMISHSYPVKVYEPQDQEAWNEAFERHKDHF